MNRAQILKLFMGLIAVLAWVGLAFQLYIMLDNAPTIGFGPGNTIINYFSFFTILSNLLVAISLSCSLIVSRSKAGRFFSNPVTRSAIGLYIIIVGLIYSIALRKIWAPQGSQKIVDHIIHDAIPLLYFILWICFVPKQSLNWRHVFPWLIFPLIYFIYSLIRGSFTGWYPYPFLHAGEIGYGKVAINSIFVLTAFLGVGLLLIAFNKMRRS